MALATAVLGPAAALPYGPEDPATTEASFTAARLMDDLAGEIADPAKEIRITFRALSRNSSAKLTATLDRDRRVARPPATGLTLTLCDAAGTDLAVSGSRYDRSGPSGAIRWKQFPLPATGDYVLIVRAATAGTWRLTLAGAHGRITYQRTSPGIAPGATDELEFDGLAGATATWTLDRTGTGPKFVGQAVEVDGPDLLPLDGVAAKATGTIRLTDDGRHRFVFKNAGTAPNSGARARVVVTPPRLVRRTGYVAAAGTTFVPVVTRIGPARAYFKESSLPVTIRGRDFQQGADVRLVRKDREDILGTVIDVASETTIRCVFDIDTGDTEGKSSVGTWTVGVWNAPVYTVPDDRSTLVKGSRTRSATRKFTSLSAGSIQLPRGVVKRTEVWFVDFNDAFQADLNRMGLGSADATTRSLARGAVEAYTILFLRDLFRCNETTGALTKNVSVPVSFVVAKPGAVSGKPGVDYNRIEVGGAYATGDLRDVAEPLLWGFAEIDTGNAVRDDLSMFDTSGTRVGRGARTAVLDPTEATAASGWTAAMQPLRASPLVASDRRYFQPGFFPADQGQADRYEEIVQQFTRAARETAAVIAHHVGKAMGIEDGVATGPMSNPTLAGDLWPATGSLSFSSPEQAALRANVRRTPLPGTSQELRVGYFPLVTTHQYLLEECTTDAVYGGPSQARFGFVGGRPNALKSQYKVQYVALNAQPFGLANALKLSFDGIDGKAPLWVDPTNNVFYYAKVFFRIAVTDKRRGGVRTFTYRLNIVPDVAKLPPALQQAAINARDTVRAQ